MNCQSVCLDPFEDDDNLLPEESLLTPCFKEDAMELQWRIASNECGVRPLNPTSRPGQDQAAHWPRSAQPASLGTQPA
jgi:hypothetical protein